MVWMMDTSELLEIPLFSSHLAVSHGSELYFESVRFRISAETPATLTPRCSWFSSLLGINIRHYRSYLKFQMEGHTQSLVLRLVK
jgi:hypothetical protein